MCVWCRDLNAEPNAISVTEIYINGNGHYNYGIPIHYCPFCGVKLKKYGGSPKEDEHESD